MVANPGSTYLPPSKCIDSMYGKGKLSSNTLNGYWDQVRAGSSFVKAEGAFTLTNSFQPSSHAFPRSAYDINGCNSVWLFRLLSV